MSGARARADYRRRVARALDELQGTTRRYPLPSLRDYANRLVAAGFDVEYVARLLDITPAGQCPCRTRRGEA